jgi:hypothetical protein
LSFSPSRFRAIAGHVFYPVGYVAVSELPTPAKVRRHGQMVLSVAFPPLVRIFTSSNVRAAWHGVCLHTHHDLSASLPRSKGFPRSPNHLGLYENRLAALPAEPIGSRQGITPACVRDYSLKRPSCTDKPLSRHPALRLTVTVTVANRPSFTRAGKTQAEV